MRIFRLSAASRMRRVFSCGSKNGDVFGNPRHDQSTSIAVQPTCQVPAENLQTQAFAGTRSRRKLDVLLWFTHFFSETSAVCFDASVVTILYCQLLAELPETHCLLHRLQKELLVISNKAFMAFLGAQRSTWNCMGHDAERMRVYAHIILHVQT